MDKDFKEKINNPNNIFKWCQKEIDKKEAKIKELETAKLFFIDKIIDILKGNEIYPSDGTYYDLDTQKGWLEYEKKVNSNFYKK